MPDEIESKIRERAHAIWEAQGRPEGLAEEHWHRAAAEVAQAEHVAELPPPLASGAAADALAKTKALKSQV